ncbi:hypothetical protein SAMD00019534_029970 [Acytostelium subglobosum LB1]|uniref:hypothetical protein n=1 Tax=Acytostelium subglobosum LB1 TaxID=1410327 RepID=UPI000644A7FB|nr:hypothetical protein SAMD00019534_029970 [Acytostelium subglobosum LB1]GAM19822.1 hypothetical protein SAMD00019534_029970 [Acytostelium subglobosum LB1]|eukprot:XP_012756584.1 hypothetical protein SAMD00019534_029970 [Acytostelium subglobosum LB1]
MSNHIRNIDDLVTVYRTNDKSALLRTTESVSLIIKTLSQLSLSSSGDGVNSPSPLSETSPLSLANILCEVIKEEVELVIPVLDQYYRCILHMLQEVSKMPPSTAMLDQFIAAATPSPTASSPLRSGSISSPRPTNLTEATNAAIYTLFGTISFLFPTNDKLLALSVPHVLKIGRHSMQIQSIVFSTLCSETVNQAAVLAPFAKDFLDYSSTYPNYLSILSGLCQHNQADFEKNIPYLMECFERSSESKASILSILSEIARHNACSLIPYVVQLKGCLLQQSLTTLFGTILKFIVAKYPSAITPIMDDILLSITMISASKYSLIQIVGMCGPEKTDKSLEFLLQLLSNEEKNTTRDSNTIVSILKGLKSIQKTSPNLLTDVGIFAKFQQSPSGVYSEFIGTLAQDIVDRIKEHAAAVSGNKMLVISLPTLLDSTLDNIDAQAQQVHQTLATMPQSEIRRYLCINHYQLCVDTLLLLPIPVQGNTATHLVFSFGGEKIEVSVVDSPRLQTLWQHVDYLQSVVNLNRFLDAKQQLQVDANSSIVQTPFLSSGEIKELHQSLQAHFDRSPPPPATTTSIAITNSPTINVIQPSDNQTTTQSSSDNNNTDNNNTITQIHITEMEPSLAIPTASSSSQPTSGATSPRPPAQVLQEGFLNKQSKYLKRNVALWFMLNQDCLTGSTKKERANSTTDNNNNNNTESRDEDTSFKIPLSEILSVKENDKLSSGTFTLKRAKDKSDALPEIKSFYIVTRKRKYLIRASSQAEQVLWVQKIKQQIAAYASGDQGSTASPIGSPQLVSASSSPPQNSANGNGNNNVNKKHKKMTVKLSQYLVKIGSNGKTSKNK